MRPVSHSQKCCVLIDGNYVDRLSRSVRFDFIEFVEFLRSKFQITNIVYFTIVPLYEDVFPKRRLLDWLSYNGFVVKEKPSKRCRSGGRCLRLSLVGNSIVRTECLCPRRRFRFRNRRSGHVRGHFRLAAKEQMGGARGSRTWFRCQSWQ